MDGTSVAPQGGLEDQQWSLVLSTYENRQALLTESEALGERRLQMFLTVIGAAGVGVGLVADQVDADTLLAVGASVSSLLMILGFLTIMRVAQRDCATSWYKLDLYRLRHFVAGANAALVKALPHMDDPTPQLRSRPWHPSRGGLVEFVGVLTAILAAIAVFSFAHLLWTTIALSLLAAVVAIVGVWLLQIWAVRGIYRREKCLEPEAPRG